MDMDYVLFAGTATVGAFAAILITYLVYRRGIAIRLAAIISGCIIIVASICFFLGKEGITLARTGIALSVGIPPVLGLFMIMFRQIVTPAKLMAATAMAIARGDVNQKVDITRRDEFGDLANAFRQMIAYLQEMANAADRLAQGDLVADVTPRSEEDRLGYITRQEKATNGR